jgi:type VII secretion protein EccE
MQRTTRVRAGQLVVAEIAVAAVVVGAFGPGWVLIGVGALAAAVLVATFGRAGGRWWYEAVASQRRFRRRRRLAATHVLAAAVGTGAVPPHLPWLRTLAPTLAIRSVQVGTATVGIGTDQDGWFGVVEVGSFWEDDVVPLGADRPASRWAPGAALPAAAGAVPLAELASLVEAGPDRVAVSCVQVVLAPGGSPQEPRPVWVAVRVTPADALAAERSGGVTAVERSVAAAAMRAARTLDGHGWPARAVGPDGLLTVLIEATGLDGPPQEHWSVWRSGRLVRTHYAVTGWTAAHGTLAHGVTHVTVSYTRRGEPAVLAAVSARPAVLALLSRDVVGACVAAGVRLRRLDGEQAPAAYATAPTAVPWANSAKREPGSEAADGSKAGRVATSSLV